MIFRISELKNLDDNIKKNHVPKILTNDYVNKLNRGIAYRIRQQEALHTEGKEIITKMIFC